MVALVLASLAVLGLLLSLYFTTVTYRWIPPDARWLPRVCRMDERTCARIVDTREARALGVPNSVLGLAWYAVLLAAALGAPVPRAALVAGALAAAALSVWLAWALVFRLRVACVLCFAGHAVNVAVLVLVLLGGP